MVKIRLKIYSTFLIVLFMYAAGPASAHHLRGLPHYSYNENYPQTPSYEETHRNGSYEIIFSYFDIFDTKNIDLAVYIKNVDTGEAYTGPVEFMVYGIHDDPADTEMNHPYYAEPNTSNTYKANWVYQDEGVYFLRVTFNDTDGSLSEEFRFMMGKVGYNKVFILGGLGGVILLMLVVAVVRGRKAAPNA